MREVKINRPFEKRSDAMNDEKVDVILRSARVDFQVADGFQHSVWSRIEAESSESRFLRGFLEWVTWPLGMATGVVAMAVIGLFLGAVTVPEPADARLSYVESISPFIHPEAR
jgi:hypothetical protein